MRRPDWILNPILYEHGQSPLLWDILATTCLTGNLHYVCVSVMPDLALKRGRLGTDASDFKR